MKKALELSPDQPYVLNYLGYSWIDQGINLDEGMKMLKRATELRPDDGAVTDSVGWAYYRLGQFDTAVDWLERASEQKGDDATVVEHLGDALLSACRQGIGIGAPQHHPVHVFQFAINGVPVGDAAIDDDHVTGVESVAGQEAIYLLLHG